MEANSTLVSSESENGFELGDKAEESGTQSVASLYLRITRFR